MNMSWLSVLGIILCVLTFIGTILIFVDKENLPKYSNLHSIRSINDLLNV